MGRYASKQNVFKISIKKVELWLVYMVWDRHASDWKAKFGRNLNYSLSESLTNCLWHRCLSVHALPLWNLLRFWCVSVQHRCSNLFVFLYEKQSVLLKSLYCLFCRQPVCEKLSFLSPTSVWKKHAQCHIAEDHRAQSQRQLKGMHSTKWARWILLFTNSINFMMFNKLYFWLFPCSMYT